MNLLLLYTFLISILFFFNCQELSPEFERIEENKLRVIGVTFDKMPEAAPGDTIIAKAWFAGNTVLSIDDFKVSYNVLNGDTFAHEFSFKPLEFKNWLPDSIQFKFIVPETLFVNLDVFNGIPKKTILKIDSLSQTTHNCANVLNSDTLQHLLDNLSKKAYLFFSAHSENGTILNIRSEFFSRYNSRFKDCILVNNNPQIKWIKAYDVEGADIDMFDPQDPAFKDKYNVSYLYNYNLPSIVTDTLHIKNGRSLFIETDTCTTDYYQNNKLEVKKERLRYTCFYQLVGIKSEEYDSVFEQSNSESRFVKCDLDGINSLEKLKIWAVVHDYVPDAVRPIGFDVKTLQVFITRK